MQKNFLGELLIILFLLIIVTIFFPIAIATIIAIWISATGLTYYLIITLIVVLIWFIMGLSFYM